MFGNFVQYNSMFCLPSSMRIKWWPVLLWWWHQGHIVSLEKLVPYYWLRIPPVQYQLRTQWFQVRYHLGCNIWFCNKLTQRNTIRKRIERCIPIHRLKYCVQGCSYGQVDIIIDVIRCHEGLHINVLELYAIRLGSSLRGYPSRLQFRNHVR